MSLRVNFFSNAPFVPTGYGNQTKLTVPRLRNLGHELSISAFYGTQGGVTAFDGMMVYPQCKHPYGQDVIGAHAEHAHADVIITLMDAWVVQPENIPSNIEWHPYFPIDCDPVPGRVLREIVKGKKPITMSKFGLHQMQNAGIDAYYAPHMVDTKIFKPIDRTEARTRLGFPLDKFIVGMVAANKGVPPRKAFFEQIAAFAAFKQDHKDALLYLHTDDGTHGGETVNLVNYCKIMRLKVGYWKGEATPIDDVDVLFPDQYANLIGLPDPYMVDMYNSLDVMMLVSMGEGFGIPLIEAQACGCPVITGDWTAMGELCFSGWKIPKEEATPEWQPFFEAFQWKTSVEAVVKRLIAAYEVRGNTEYRDRARKGALAYDCDRVIEKYWKPILEDIEANLHKGSAFEEALK